MVNYIFIAMAWGRANGGINSFNIELIKNLASFGNDKVNRILCIVPYASNTEIRNAKKINIELISLLTEQESTDFFYFIKPTLLMSLISYSEEKQDQKYLIIGHDVFTGGIANSFSKVFKEKHPNVSVKSFVFHHMNYLAYKGFSPSSTTKKLEKQINGQSSILQNADIVCAVGPKLRASANTKLRIGGGRSKTSLMFIPGIFSKRLPSTHLVFGNSYPKTLQAITYGRYDHEANVIKQTTLVVAAYAKLRSEQSGAFTTDSKLLVIGVGNDAEANDLQKVYKKYHNTEYIHLYSLPYSDNEKELFGNLANSHICLMLSVHEGFGLVGYEAIGYQVPLILTKNSGLYDFLISELASMKWDIQDSGLYAIDIKGSSSDEIDEVDLESTREAITKVAENIDYYYNSISALKMALCKKYSWKHVIADFVNMIDYEFSEIRKIEENIFKKKSRHPKADKNEVKRLQEESHSYFQKGDIENAYKSALSALSLNRTDTLSILRAAKAAIRLNRNAFLSKLKLIDVPKKDDAYYYFLMQYYRIIEKRHDEVLRIYHKDIKDKAFFSNAYEAASSTISLAYLAVKSKARQSELLRQARDLISAAITNAYSKNKECYWMEVTLILLYIKLETPIAERIIESEKVLVSLNEYISNWPDRVAARVYRQLLYMLLDREEEVLKVMLSDKAELAKETIISNVYVDEIPKKLNMLYHKRPEILKKYTQAFDQFLEGFKQF